MNKKTLVIPCSGIGKVHGLMSREAVYKALEGEAEHAETLCLARLVTGDQEAVDVVKRANCVTVDGCAKLCAYKNVEMAGATVSHKVSVIDAILKHKGAQPGRASSLTEDGWAIVNDVAAEVTAAIRSLETSMEVCRE